MPNAKQESQPSTAQPSQLHGLVGIVREFYLVYARQRDDDPWLLSKFCPVTPHHAEAERIEEQLEVMGWQTWIVTYDAQTIGLEPEDFAVIA